MTDIEMIKILAGAVFGVTILICVPSIFLLKVKESRHQKIKDNALFSKGDLVEASFSGQKGQVIKTIFCADEEKVVYEVRFYTEDKTPSLARMEEFELKALPSEEKE